ncbi:MAG: GntR family transcriptional regulator [Gammaproteobacteria bacterium]|nr:GntR family transcriptional regulator [Gammaproteobacteria bacterium]
MTAYQKISDEITGLIDKRVLREGDRLPSVRRATRSHRVNAGTVLRAYHDLEAQGLIESRPRSGYYVRARVTRRVPEPAVAVPAQAHRIIVRDLVVELVKAMKRPHLIPLGLGVLNPELLPIDDLNQAAARVVRRLKPVSVVRDLTPGDPELRRLIALRYLDSGCAIDQEEIVVMSGGLEAVVLCLRAVTKPGDAVAVESPNAWPQLTALAALGLRVREIPTDFRVGPDLVTLENIFRSRAVKACLLAPTFQNPLGSLMSDENKRLLALIVGRYKIPLIENDRVAELFFGEPRPRPVKAYDASGHVMHCGSLATCIAPAYQVGWIAAGKYRNEVARTKILLSLYTAPACQAVMAEYLAHGPVERHLQRLRQALAMRCNTMVSAISEEFPVGCRATHPMGGFVLWVELPKGADSLKLYQLAFAKGISIAPGPMFSARRGYRNCLRLNFGYAPVQQIRDGIHILAPLIRRASQ